MWFQKRTGATGKIYYSILTKDKNGKTVRIKNKDLPKFESEEQVRTWIKSQEAFRKSKTALIEQKIKWKTTYYNFEDLLKKYEVWQQKKAPNSYKSYTNYLEHYIMPWFLDKNQASNVNNWHLLFFDFRDYLESQAKNLKNLPMSYGAKKCCIQTLNTFMTFLVERNLLDPDCYKKCPTLRDPEKFKGLESVVQQDSYLRIIQKLEGQYKDLFTILYHTGMRQGEALGLSMDSLFGGKLDNALGKSLEEKEISYLGYLVLESQPKYKNRKRNPDGTIDRKPLKQRPSISAKNSRIVPIFEKETWNLLVALYQKQEESFEKKAYGKNRKNYILFDEIKVGSLHRVLSNAIRDSNCPKHTWHDLRHTFCTRFVSNTRDFFLAKTILGHQSKVFERYLHLSEQMVREVNRDESLIRIVD